MWLFVAGLIASPFVLVLAFFIYSYSVVPPQVSGKKLMRQKISQIGLDPDRISDACYDSLVAYSWDAAQVLKSGYPEETLLTLMNGHIAIIVPLIGCVLEGAEIDESTQDDQALVTIRDILIHHCIELPQK